MKIRNIIFFILICFSSVVFAAGERTYSIVDFSKGLNSFTSQYLIPKDQGIVCQNVRVNKEFGALSKKSKSLSYGTVGSYKVNSIFRYYKSDASKYLLAAYSTLLSYGNDGTGVFTTLHTGLSSADRVAFVTYKDNAIMVPESGNQPLKWDGETTTTANTDGARTAGYLCAELGAPYATLATPTGASLDASKWYAYQIAHFNSTSAVYQYATSISNTILTGAAVYDIDLSDIPLGETGTTSRLIYRTEGASSRANVLVALAADELYQVDELTNNTATTFTDDVTDDTLDDDTTPTWATVAAGVDVTPPTGKYATIIDQRLFIAGNSTYQSDLYYSSALKPDIFDTGTDYEQIRPDDGDVITFIKPVLGILRIGKTNTIQSIYTKGASTSWYISDPFTFVGCPAPYTAVLTPKGLFYLGWDGIYNFNGQYANLVSEVVTNEIRDISKANIAECAATYLENEYRLAYPSDASGETINNRVLVYDIVKDAYVLDIMDINCWCTFASGSDSYVLYSGSSNTDGYVLAHSSGVDLLRIKSKTEIDDGTKNDTHSTGDDDSPVLDLGWDCTIAGWLTELQTKDASISTIADIETYLSDATIARPDTDGTWTSPVFQINASKLNKIYWNEDSNGVYGTVTMQIRTGATTPADGTWSSWSTAVSDPNGSDVSSVTANTYIQIRSNLSTTDIDYSPTLFYDSGYVIKIDYSISGSAYESTIVSIFGTGWTNFDVPTYKSNIHRIKVFYTGTSGTLNFSYTNDEGSFTNDFDIDLSMAPDISSQDAYTGNDDYKVYTHIPGVTTNTKGQFYKFNLTENGIVDWDISRIEVIFKSTERYD